MDVDGLGTSVEVGVSGVVARSLEAGVGRDDVGFGGEDSAPEGVGAVRGAVYAPSCSCRLLCGGETVIRGRADARLSVLRRADSSEPFGRRRF